MIRNIIYLTILLTLSLYSGAYGQQQVPTSGIGSLGGSSAASSGGQASNTGGSAASQNQQGGQVATLTATTINNGYSQGRPIRVGGTSIRLNLRLLPQQRQQVATFRQYRLNLRLGRHGFIQPNNSGTTGGTTGGGTTGGGTTGGGTTGGGTTGGTTGGGSGGEIPGGAVGMSAQGSVRN